MGQPPHGRNRRRSFGHRTAVLTVFLAVTFSGCTTGTPPIRVRLTGAQIATELVQSWLDAAKSSRFDVRRSRNPTWSQVGFDALARGECDLACTDRPITVRELKNFGSRAVQGYRVGFYGYALYVHPDNKLDSVFADHISLVFQKKILAWKELAGLQIPELEGPIHLYGPRKATRGGMVLMQQAKIWFAEPTWEPLDSDAEIIARVAGDPLGLGFAGIGYDEGVRCLGIRMHRKGPPAFPSLEEIESERYGLAKVIYAYCIAPPNRAAEAVIEYLFSDAGRRAIESTGVWPIPRERAVAAPLP